ncbi:hypothetical protein Tco_1507933 [Tanacetum coccineum]|uniref:Uncharacterized protein n=1 Tax=Tanacetum coccineum TaxID=301880 RepID=A0ABQ5CFJ2_9ASTR
MANIRTCNKHNMIACVEKTAQNADFYQIIDFLTGCSINYSLLVDPDLIGPWLQQFWAYPLLSNVNNMTYAHPRQGSWQDDFDFLKNHVELTYSLMRKNEPTVEVNLFMSYSMLSPKTLHGEQFGNKTLASALVRSIVFEQAVRGSDRPQEFVTSTLAAEGKNIRTVLILGLHVLQGYAQGTQLKSVSFSTYCFSYRYCFLPWYCTPLDSDAVQLVLIPVQASQTSRGVEGLLDYIALNKELETQRGKPFLKLTNNQAQSQLKNSSNCPAVVQPSLLFGYLSEEHNVQEEDTTHPFFDDIVDKDAAVTPDLERKSDETEEVNIEEKEAF